MNIRDRIEQLDYWRHYRPFTAQDIRQALGVHASAVSSALYDMREELHASVTQLNNGTVRYSYKRRSPAAPWLRMAWVSPWAVGKTIGREAARCG